MGANVTVQLLVLSSIFLILALVIDSAYALFASKLNKVAFGRSRDRISGALLIIAGAGLAVARRG